MKRYPIFSATWPCQKLLSSVEDLMKDVLVQTPEEADVFLVGGWDGWMLDAMRTYHEFALPFFGLHCGTLWFLMNRCEDAVCDPTGPSLQEMNLQDISSDDLDLFTQTSIRVDIQTASWEKVSWFAFNDITLGGSVLDYFAINLEVEWEIEQFQWTWCVISTPLWSTAYAANLGTPIIPLHSEMRSISGIATGNFAYRFVSPQEISLSIQGRTSALVGLDWVNQVIQDVTKITLRPWISHATLAFLSSQWFADRRLLLAQQKMGNR